MYFIDRAEGGCRQIAAAPFELLATVVNSEMETCTSKVCTLVRKGKRNEGCLPVCQLDVGRPQYGKLMTKRPSMSDFQPMTTSYNKRGLILQFQKELSNVYCDAVVLKIINILLSPLMLQQQKVTSQDLYLIITM